MTYETLTIACLKCGKPHTYVRTRSFRKYCSHKCAVEYNAQLTHNKLIKSRLITEYYIKFPHKRFLASTKASAKKRNLVFDISETWFKSKLARGFCEISGLPIKTKTYEAGKVGERSFYSPSIDRIDNAIGYVESNCRIVCWGLNMAKSKFTDRDINALALSLVLSHIPERVQQDVISCLPKNLLASLPSGNPYY
ncbi:hypothetical protein [Methylicorpusculum sp.]|uniref:hypothetical protein n=1 Tax=Methylicorpusculum sp. TaxID=2713644 RepID=UPI0027197964|nr:hypothetical protein [Methylicorpusculum sp.]MDO8844472.1 hypothetical protein [Methylicorpusculum sp.]MDP2179081.1 hypothetical protein [Methylicorpusculum sp.]MDP3529452.1 hypothetical protein [Methylicorpusculum sp.]